MRNENYEKTKASLRYWLLGRNYTEAHDAMELGLSLHTGFRKDGKTPEFQHQISQANYIRTLEKMLIYPEKNLVVAFLHDIVEDEGYPLEEIYEYYGNKSGLGVSTMTKPKGFQKTDVDYQRYYENMHLDPLASINKPVDRIHNHQTMSGVFTPTKQLAYITETRTYIFPMLKKARKKFPKQESAYQNLKTVLTLQVELIELNLISAGVNVGVLTSE